MTYFAARRVRNSVITLAVALAVLGIDTVFHTTLHSTRILSGWVLLATIVLLALYNIRKKLHFLPLGSSASWLQLHIYAGLLTFVLALVHVRYSIPDGVFDTVLALLYFFVCLSGLVGLAMSRLFGPRLTTQGNEVLFERIPLMLQRIRENVEKLILEIAAQPDSSSAVSDFYVVHLKPFFERPRHFWPHVFQSRRPFRVLLLQLRAQTRFLNEDERQALNYVEEQIRIKNELDYQYALQASLKYWLFVHIPLTYGLLLFSLFHVLLVYAYRGRI